MAEIPRQKFVDRAPKNAVAENFARQISLDEKKWKKQRIDENCVVKKLTKNPDGKTEKNCGLLTYF
jgi:hypothetical protein